MGARDIGTAVQFPAEAELLLECVAVQRGRFEFIPYFDNIDWRKAAAIAMRHGVLPSFYQALKSCAEIAPDIREAIRRDVLANVLNAKLLTSELARLSAMFERERIPTIAFKGPVLAMMAYGDAAMRQFSDIDILVGHSDLPYATELLERDGFIARRLRPGALDRGPIRYSEDEFIKAGGNYLVDLHWELMPPHFDYGPRADAIWQRAVTVAMPGFEVRSLSPADLVLFLCAHGAKHGWVCLGWVLDLARVLTVNSELDWEQLLNMACQTGSRRMLLLGLTLAHDLAGLELPSGIAQLCADDQRTLGLAHEIKRRMFRGIDERPGLFSDWIVPMRSIDGWRGRLGYFRQRALHPTIDDAEFVELPDALRPLYYLLRPIRLVIQQGPRLIGSVRPAGPVHARRTR